MRVREARADERDGIAEIHAASATVAYAHIFPGQPFPLEATRRRWREFPGSLVVAEEGGRLLGFAAFDDQWLHGLFVVPELWGTGAGHVLLEAAGPVRLLWVLADNPRARHFYERHGWAADGAEEVRLSVPHLRYRRQPPGPMQDPVGAEAIRACANGARQALTGPASA